MESDMDGKEETMPRLISCLSSPYLEHQQFLHAVPMQDTSAGAISEELVTQLTELDILDNIVAAAADTTNVNFGIDNGAIYRLQVLLGRPFLELPCLHHIFELPAKAVMLAVSGRDSTAPTDPLFVRWQSNWNRVKAAMAEVGDVFYRSFDYGAKAGTKCAVIATEVKEWAKEAATDNVFGRRDYETALTYTSLYLGAMVPNTMKRPCHVSKARFLQIALYYLQIFLLSDLPIVRSMFNELKWSEIDTMAEYCALHYVPMMLAAKLPAAAPRLLLNCVARLRAVRRETPLVARTALKTMLGHLSMISPELAVFSVFDVNLPNAARKAIATKLIQCKELFLPGERLIYIASVPGPNFCFNGRKFWGHGTCTCRCGCKKCKVVEGFEEMGVEVVCKEFCTGCTDTIPSIDTFINGRSFLLWEVSVFHFLFCSTFVSVNSFIDPILNMFLQYVTQVQHQDHTKMGWLERPVEEWEADPHYKELFEFVTNLLVVNDCAERYIKLVSERIKTVRSEKRLRETVLTVAEMNRLSMGFKRETLKKKQIEDVLKKMLKMGEEVEGEEVVEGEVAEYGEVAEDGEVAEGGDVMEDVEELLLD